MVEELSYSPGLRLFVLTCCARGFPLEPNNISCSLPLGEGLVQFRAAFPEVHLECMSFPEIIFSGGTSCLCVRVGM